MFFSNFSNFKFRHQKMGFDYFMRYLRILFVGCGHHSSGHCPSGFQLDHSCYHVGKEAKNWHDAEVKMS